MHTARPLRELQSALREGVLPVSDLIENAITTAVWRRESGAKTFLQLDPASVRAQLAGVDLTAPLGGLPISVKDCFDVAGVPSTAGSSFYAETRPVPAADSWFAARARAAGGVLMGKTHLNEFAYGITGENLHHGPCHVPARPTCLTGGSSSGAAASVAEGSAVIGLGTDTGGSLRAPASFCGLVSLRPTHGTGDFTGCFPLAQSFDTMGFLVRHLADVPAVAQALLDLPCTEKGENPPRIGFTEGSWLDGCEFEALSNYQGFAARLREAGAEIGSFESADWAEAAALFVPIQAHEAFANHREYLPTYRERYEPAVRARIEFGGTISQEAYDRYQARRAAFRELQTARHFSQFDFLAVPICPVLTLKDGDDHSSFRSRILTLTTPASVCGWPVLTVRGRGRGPEDPESHGCGIGLMARPGADAKLLGLARWLAERGF